jgi:hypothetical protein
LAGVAIAAVALVAAGALFFVPGLRFWKSRK